MVLWLAAALAAIAFSLANTVRGESERSAAAVDGVRSYYLAEGAIERALLYMDWSGHTQPDGTTRYWSYIIPSVRMEFPSGEATVEFIPETAKLNVNYAPPEELYRMLTALGADPARARTIAMGIVDWRSRPEEGATEFDQYYLSLTPSFPSRHASFEETEELLLIKGMTPELYYGNFDRDDKGRLRPRGGLRDCLSVYGTGGAVDVNTAEPAVLAAIGLSPEAVAFIAETRRNAPLTPERLQSLGEGPGFNRLRIGGNRIYTLRATARLRGADGNLSDMRRSVAATVARPTSQDPGTHILRWYENVWVR